MITRIVPGLAARLPVPPAGKDRHVHPDWSADHLAPAADLHGLDPRRPDPHGAGAALGCRAVDDDINFLPARCDSVRGFQLLRQAFPRDVFASRVILVAERADRPLDEADFALIDRTVDAVNGLRQAEPDLQIGRVDSHRDGLLGRRLVSADGHCTLIQVSLGTPFLALQTRTSVDRVEATARGVFAEAGAAAPPLLVTGPAGIGRDLTAASAASLEGTTLATIGLVIVVLLLVYRAPLLALVPLATIAVSVWVALNGLALLTLIPGVYLVNVSKVFAIVLLYGAGTDYCLFLISRYREELARGHDGPSAIRGAVGHVGGALAASAGTVIWGLGLMVFAEFAKVRCAGPAIALALAVALLASLTLTPALLTLLGQRVFWPGRVPAPADLQPSGFWARASSLVVARPATVLVAGLVVLLPLAVLGYRVKANYKPMGELRPTDESVRGLEVVQSRFTAGETGPITVLLTAPTDWTSPEGRQVIDHLSRGFGYLDNVAEVRSLTQPLGTPLPPIPEVRTSHSRGLLGSLLRTVKKSVDETREETDRKTRDFYLAELPEAADGRTHVTRIDVVLHSDPFAPESKATLAVIQTWLRDELPRRGAALGGVGTECYGVTVNARDLAQVTKSDRRG